MNIKYQDYIKENYLDEKKINEVIINFVEPKTTEITNVLIDALQNSDHPWKDVKISDNNNCITFKDSENLFYEIYISEKTNLSY